MTGQKLSNGVRVGVAFLKVYKCYVSPFLPPRCRFFPTCSEYAVEALQKHGLVKGTQLALQRLCRCHPWGKSGIDPVPCMVKTKD